MALEKLRRRWQDSSMQGTIPRERFPSDRELWWSKTRRSQSKAMARPPPSTRPCKAAQRKSISLKRSTARNKLKGADCNRDSPFLNLHSGCLQGRNVDLLPATGETLHRKQSQPSQQSLARRTLTSPGSPEPEPCRRNEGYLAHHAPPRLSDLDLIEVLQTPRLSAAARCAHRALAPVSQRRSFAAPSFPQFSLYAEHQHFSEKGEISCPGDTRSGSNG